MDLLNAALKYAYAGIPVHPCRERESPGHTRKSPYLNNGVNGASTDEAMIRAWWTNWPEAFIGIPCGVGEARLESVDFEFGDTYHTWANIIRERLPDLFPRLVIEKTLRGGYHVYFRIPDAGRPPRKSGELDGKLAHKFFPGSEGEITSVRGEDKICIKQTDGRIGYYALSAEVRYKGMYVVAAPSPGYIAVQGDLTQCPLVTYEEWEDLIAAARELEERPLPVFRTSNNYRATEPSEDQPGTHYNRSGILVDLLTDCGYHTPRQKGEHTYLTRPGKRGGVSVSVFRGDRGDSLVTVFSTAPETGFPDAKTYTAFAAYAFLKCSGDFGAAAGELRGLGFGEPTPIIDLSGVDLSQFKLGSSKASQILNQPDEPFPQDLLKVPGFIGDFVRHCVATAPRPQPVIALSTAIGIMGTLAGRKLRDEYDIRTNVYCISVADPGYGKENPRNKAKNILLRVNQGMNGPENFGSYQSLFPALQRNGSQLAQIDEFGAILRTIGKADKSPQLQGIVTLLLKLYTSSNTLCPSDSKVGLDPLVDNTIILDQPCLCMVGSTAPEPLMQSFTMGDVTGGFLARCFIFEGSMTRLTRNRPADVPQSLIDVAKSWDEYSPADAGNLAKIHPKPRTVPYGDGVEEHFFGYGERADDAIAAQGKPYGLLWARACEKARKLALVHACSRGGPTVDEVTMEDAVWGTKLVDYLTRRMIVLATRNISESAFDADRLYVLAKIEAAGESGITKNELTRKSQKLKNSLRNEILASLVEAGTIIATKGGTEQAPKTHYTHAAFLPRLALFPAS